MESTGTKQAREKSVNPAAVSTPERRIPQGSARRGALAPEQRSVGYGLPCARCHAYYPADLQACPICESPERVSPTAPVVHSMVSGAPATATGTQIDDDRD